MKPFGTAPLRSPLVYSLNIAESASIASPTEGHPPRQPPLPPRQGSPPRVQGQAGLRYLPHPCPPWRSQEARAQVRTIGN